MRWAIALSLILLAGCQKEPRSVSYFETHPDEAQRVVASCRSGAHRGSECDNAQGGLARVEAERRLQLFKKGFE